MRIFLFLFSILSNSFAVDSCSNTTVWTFSNPDYRLCLVGDQVFVQGNGNDVMKLYIDGGINVQGGTSSPGTGSGSSGTPNRMWEFQYSGISQADGSWYRIPNFRAWGGFRMYVGVYNGTNSGNLAKFGVDDFIFWVFDSQDSAYGTVLGEQKFTNISAGRYTNGGVPVPLGEIKVRQVRGGYSDGFDPSVLEVYVSDWSNYHGLTIMIEALPHFQWAKITDNSRNEIAPNFPPQVSAMTTSSSSLNSISTLNTQALLSSTDSSNSNPAESLEKISSRNIPPPLSTQDEIGLLKGRIEDLETKLLEVLSINGAQISSSVPTQSE